MTILTMNNWKPTKAKHCTVESIHALRRTCEALEVYDDEEEGYLSLYLADGDKRWPARTLSLEDPKRVKVILQAWCASRPLIDKRNDQTTPLL